MEDFNDARTVKDFRLTTFSGYQKTKVRDELIKSLRDRKIEPACYWTAEMVASGHFSELWEACFLFFTQCIHLGNPKMVFYLRERYGLFYELSHSTQTVTGSQVSVLELRNQKSIRTLFTEIVCVLALSLRKPTLSRAILPSARHLHIEPDSPLDAITDADSSTTPCPAPFDYLHPSHVLSQSRDASSFSSKSPQPPPLDSSSSSSLYSTTEPTAKVSARKRGSAKKQYLFHPSFMMDRVSAPHTHYYVLKRPKDPEEWFVAMNELAYHMSEERRSMLDACFWIEWMLEYDSYCRTHSKEWASANAGSTQINKGATRTEMIDGLVISKYGQDMIWAIWELLLSPSRIFSPDSLWMKLLKNAHVLFCVDYTTASCSKKRFWLYFALSIRTEIPAMGSDKIIQDESRELIQRVVQKSDDVYLEIKSAEQRPVTDYLMAGVRERSHRDETIQAMEAMQSVDMFQLNGLRKKGPGGY
jgi:hypothetical protein